MRDLINNIKAKPLLPPMVVQQNTQSALLETVGFESVTLVVTTGGGFQDLSEDVYSRILLEHGQQQENMAPVPLAQTIGAQGQEAGLLLTLNSPDQQGYLYSFGYTGDKDYLRLRIVLEGEHESGVPLQAMAILGHGEHMPPESHWEQLEDIEGYL